MEGHSKQDICQDIACIQCWDPGAEDSSFGTENPVQGCHYIFTLQVEWCGKDYRGFDWVGVKCWSSILWLISP